MSKKIKHWFPITGLLAILNFGLISTPLQAATYTVCPVGCNYTTISVAITNAVSGDVIFVGPGTYNGNITIDRNIQIVGTGTGSTIIHGDNTASVVTINAGVVVTITGVTIENGAGNITLPASVPTNPTDKSGRRVGGGIDNKGTLTLSHSLVQDNTVNGEDSSGRYSALGGGIFNETAASLTISYSTVLNNRANGGRGIRGGGGGGGFGGGIYNTSGATLLIHNSAIISNIAQGGASNLSNGTGGGGAGLGGGLFSESVLTVTNSTFAL
jgi:hypothetical protein